MSGEAVVTPPEAVGRDHVRFRGGAVIVDSAAEMPDWEFRAYRRTALMFRDRRYFVSGPHHRLRPELRC